MAALEKYLQTLADDKPCGEDTWVASGYQLQQPIEPAWKNEAEPTRSELSEAALTWMQRTRYLRVADVLCRARPGRPQEISQRLERENQIWEWTRASATRLAGEARLPVISWT